MFVFVCDVKEWKGEGEAGQGAMEGRDAGRASGLGGVERPRGLGWAQVSAGTGRFALGPLGFFRPFVSRV